MKTFIILLAAAAMVPIDVFLVMIAINLINASDTLSVFGGFTLLFVTVVLTGYLWGMAGGELFADVDKSTDVDSTVHSTTTDTHNEHRL